MTLGNRVAVLDDGSLQQVAPPQELYDYPANPFVAEFIGEPAMNVAPVDVAERASAFVVDHNRFTFWFPDQDVLSTASDSDLPFGVPPEDVSLGSNLSDAAETFEATVTVREPLEELLLLHCRVGNDELSVKIEPRSEIQIGETIEIGFDEERLHLFETATGDAVYHSTPREAATVDQVAVE